MGVAIAGMAYIDLLIDSASIAKNNSFHELARKLCLGREVCHLIQECLLLTEREWVVLVIACSFFLLKLCFDDAWLLNFMLAVL